jgi:hypothetical protein
MCVFHQLWFKPHKNFDFEVFSIYELNTPKYLTIFLVKAEVIIFSWISNQHQKHKSGGEPSNEHFWQVWFNSVQWFQRRRFKCEKLTNGRRMLSHDKSKPEALKSLYRSPGNKKNQLVLCKNYVLQW